MPVYAYDVAKHGHESGHTGVMLPDPSRAAREGRAKARKRAKDEKKEKVVVEKVVKENAGEGAGEVAARRKADSDSKRTA